MVNQIGYKEATKLAAHAQKSFPLGQIGMDWYVLVLDMITAFDGVVVKLGSDSIRDCGVGISNNNPYFLRYFMLLLNSDFFTRFPFLIL